MTIKSTFIDLAVAAIDQVHERAKLLAAYRLRHRWKASDIAKLRQLNLSPVAERRIALLEGLGRPVITHATPASKFAQKAVAMMTVLNEQTSPSHRLASIKHTHWWPHYVEAIYRGEYEAIKAQGLGSPSEKVEEIIAENLGISSAVVRKICTKVRRIRSDDFESANFPSARICDFMDWMRTGKRERFIPL